MASNHYIEIKAPCKGLGASDHNILIQPIPGVTHPDSVKRFSFGQDKIFDDATRQTLSKALTTFWSKTHLTGSEVIRQIPEVEADVLIQKGGSSMWELVLRHYQPRISLLCQTVQALAAGMMADREEGGLLGTSTIDRNKVHRLHYVAKKFTSVLEVSYQVYYDSGSIVSRWIAL